MNTKEKEYTLYDCWEILSHYHAGMTFGGKVSKAEQRVEDLEAKKKK